MNSPEHKVTSAIESARLRAERRRKRQEAMRAELEKRTHGIKGDEPPWWDTDAAERWAFAAAVAMALLLVYVLLN